MVFGVKKREKKKKTDFLQSLEKILINKVSIHGCQLIEGYCFIISLTCIWFFVLKNRGEITPFSKNL